ncbi:MAG TPA: VWA domain-containing protein, partial [Pyrinomonadaceae bacterium]|nr:VWA domain-containing protein [Pyrinomonadaceae bacterium]
MKKFLTALISAVLLCSPGYPQKPITKPAGDEDAVVKISTDLVQIDVTVTDKNGKVVPDLKAEDFEVFENGQKQSVSGTNFLFRSVGGASASDSVSPSRSTGISTPPVAEPPVRSSIRRTVAVVIDDLNLSFGSIYQTRKALKKFVDEQMQPEDLVAIIRASGGAGALQQFTTDKRVLHAAIDKLRWNPSTSGVDSLTAVSQNDADITDRFRRESDLAAGGQSKQQTVVLQSDTAHDKKSADVTRNSNAQERGIYAQTSLGALKYVLSGMRSLPGRKAMMFFSDGIDIGNPSTKSRAQSVFDYLQEVAEMANRSSVVVYTFDTKGMRSMSIGASDNTYEIIDGHREQKVATRTEDFKNSQDGLVYFAKRTGGRAFLNSDNFNFGIEQALNEQSGYYLLAYIPTGESFDPAKRKFNKLEVRVKRPGLYVSHRSGFFNEVAAGDLASDGRKLANVLLSPFVENEIALSVNALYANDKKDGPYIRSFLHIDAKGLKFSDDAGWKQSTFDIVAAAFGSDGLPVETKESQYTIKTKGATYEAMLDRGFVYTLPVPLKKPGLYQFRVAIRDTATGMIGSAQQVIEVPDVSKDRLVLSNIAVENVSNETWLSIAAGKVGVGPGKIQVPSTLLYDTVLHRFRAGSVLRYGC